MKLRRIAVGVLTVILMSGSTLAFGEAAPGRKPVKAMTCGDFVLMDDAIKPEIVYWAAISDRGGRARSAEIDVDGTDRMVPVLIAKCKDAPRESFLRTVQAEARKIEKGL